MTTKTPTATGRTTADEPTTQARPQGTHIGRKGTYRLWTAEHPLTESVQPVILSEVRSQVSWPGGYSSPGLLIASG